MTRDEAIDAAAMGVQRTALAFASAAAQHDAAPASESRARAVGRLFDLGIVDSFALQGASGAKPSASSLHDRQRAKQRDAKRANRRRA